ncbi:hypothetical protein [Bdellovibrio sp. HCB209]|uniref:hypothetical protein n=1 Tax=Bdellovibrio sp. HCB209 TaxID=3394354 RepID=UPI0039B49E7C
MKKTTTQFLILNLISALILVGSTAEAKFCGFKRTVECSGMVTTESSSGYMTYVLNRVVYDSCGREVSNKLHKLMGTPEDIERQIRKARCSVILD